MPKIGKIAFFGPKNHPKKVSSATWTGVFRPPPVECLRSENLLTLIFVLNMGFFGRFFFVRFCCSFCFLPRFDLPLFLVFIFFFMMCCCWLFYCGVVNPPIRGDFFVMEIYFILGVQYGMGGGGRWNIWYSSLEVWTCFQNLPSFLQLLLVSLFSPSSFLEAFL